jgi:hypothetical protein
VISSAKDGLVIPWSKDGKVSDITMWTLAMSFANSYLFVHSHVKGLLFLAIMLAPWISTRDRRAFTSAVYWRMVQRIQIPFQLSSGTTRECVVTQKRSQWWTLLQITFVLLTLS